MINVVIADDYELIREGLKQMLTKKKTNDIKIVREVTNAGELMAVLAEKQPDIVLFNINISGKNGLEVLKDINMMYPNIPVLVFSTQSDDNFAIRALKSGASGCLSKMSISKELVAAIRLIVMKKQKYVSPEVAGQLALYVDSTEPLMIHEKLSDREYQVLCMIASRKKLSEIANELSLSTQTIHTYKTSLKKKMKMQTDSELTKYMIEHNLID